MADDPTKFPKTKDLPRLQDYAYYDKIYAGEHFEAFSIKGEKDFTENYKRLRYIVANFGGLMSRVMADMLFGEKLTIDVKNNQEWVDQFSEQNQLVTQLYESALANSRRGDSLFKLRIDKRNAENQAEKPSLILEEVSAAYYFPEFGTKNARYTPTADVLVWGFTQDGKDYMHKETHQPGTIKHQVYLYSPKDQKIISEVDVKQFGYDPVENTKVARSLVFHVPNFRDGTGFFGTSDYKDLIPLFFALNNRITKIDNILDKHSDPILAVPPGVIDEKGKIRKEALGMFEVDSENPGFNKPEYIVWNANLEAAFSEIDKLVEMLFMFSEIAPATMGADKDGQAESGRALKFKLLATIRKRNRKMRYYDQVIKDIIETAQQLAIAHKVDLAGVKITTPERPVIDWGDGVINDETEMVDNAVKRVDAGLSSRADEIAKLDGKSPEEAKEKVEEIDAELALDTPITNKPPTPEPVAPPAGA